MDKHRPLLLVIFDGWGYREETANNAIAQANTPHFDKLWRTCPHTLLNASGKYVGLPDDQMGNSEVGHMNLGAGRTVYQDLTRISQMIDSGKFEKNLMLSACLNDLQKSNKALHIMGLLSPGGVHSHETHLHAMLKMAAKTGLKKVYLHLFLDGRDVAPKSAESSLKATEDLCKQEQCGRITTITGRYYAMDRDQRWERIEPAYNAIVSGETAFHASDALEALHEAYARNETDEFVQATRIGDPVVMQDGDAVIFCNFRADRARQLSRMFLDESFSDFPRKALPRLSHFVTFTEYDATLSNAEVAFPKETLNQVFGEYIAEKGLTQLRVAETEKYAHVTFFFNGGKETPFINENRILIPSPKVATYDLHPEMSAPEVTETLIEAIHQKYYDVIICNFANADMLGHTGNLAATIQAINCLDDCLGQLVTAINEVKGELIITADHGNADCMYDHMKEQPLTSHTNNLVPFIYVGRDAVTTKKNGCLSDVAPTMLYVLGLDTPKEMTGQSLIQWHED